MKFNIIHDNKKQWVQSIYVRVQLLRHNMSAYSRAKHLFLLQSSVLLEFNYYPRVQASRVM